MNTGLSDYWDTEPTCTCTSTDRGTDMFGCELHDAPTASSTDETHAEREGRG